MGSLSGSKIKDTFGLLLKMASSTVSASEQLVQDGEGNNTALKLSTDTVESTGDFKCTGTMATSTSDVQALMLSSTGVFVKRDLSANPIGTSSVTANSPLSATGSTIGVLPAGSLSPLTEETAVNADKLLIWDESASAYKYITLVELSDYVVNTGATLVPTMLMAKPQATTSITAEPKMISFAELYASTATGLVTPATSSVAYGGATATMSFVDSVGVRDNIRLSAESMYEIVAVVEYNIASGTPDITTQLYINDGASSVVLIEDTEPSKAGKFVVTLRYFYYADASVPYDIALRCTSSSTITLTKNTTVTVTNLGQLALAG